MGDDDEEERGRETTGRESKIKSFHVNARKIKTFCAFFSWAIDNNYRSTSYRRSLLHSVNGRKLL